MAWGGISSHACRELVFIQNETLNAHRCFKVILEDHVVPFMGYLGEEATFMHDNERPHTARLVSVHLDEVQSTLFVSPARSPDLNPIEHIYGYVCRPPEILETFATYWRI
nr:unnamed protein product [Callosobruchus chinensis]